MDRYITFQILQRVSSRYLCVAVSAGDPEVLFLGGGVQKCDFVDSKLLVHLRHGLLGWATAGTRPPDHREGHGGGSSSSNMTIHVAPWESGGQLPRW